MVLILVHCDTASPPSAKNPLPLPEAPTVTVYYLVSPMYDLLTRTPTNAFLEDQNVLEHGGSPSLGLHL